MESRIETDIQDSVISSTQLSTATPLNAKRNTEYLRIHGFWNVVNSRYIYYASKKLSGSSTSKPKEDYKTASAIELDCYMDSLLDRYVEHKFVNCALNSESLALRNTPLFIKNKRMRSQTLKGKMDDHAAELMKLKLLHYEMISREEQIFLESLDESDMWRELEEEYRQKSNEAIKTFGGCPQNESRLHEAVKKDSIRTKKLEEINKALLLGTNVDYLEDEESKKIMLTEDI